MMNAFQLQRQSSLKQARDKRVRALQLLRNDPSLVKLSIVQANLGTALLENHVVSDVDIDVANILSLADRRRGNWLAIEPLFCYLQACRGCPLCSRYRQRYQTDAAGNGGTNAGAESTRETSGGALRKVKIQCSLQDTDISGYERSRQRAVSRGRYWIDNFQIADQMHFALAKHPNVSEVELHVSMRSHLWALKHFLVQTAASSSIATLTMIGTFTSIAAYEDVADTMGLHTTALSTLSITSAQPRRHLEPMLRQLHNCRNLRHLSLEFVEGHLDGEVDEDIDENTSYPLLLAALAANTNLERLNLTVEYLDRLTSLWEPLNDHSTLHQCKVWVRQPVDPDTLIQTVSASTKLSHLVVELDKHQMNAQSWQAVMDTFRTRAPSIQARLSISDCRPNPGSFELNTSMARIYISQSPNPHRGGSGSRQTEQPPTQSHIVQVEYPGCFVREQLLWSVLWNRDLAVPLYTGPRTPSLTFAYFQDRYELTAAYCMGFDSNIMNFLQHCRHLSKLIVCNTDTVSVQSITSTNTRLTFSPRRQSHRRRHRQMPAMVPLVSTFLRHHESVVDLTLSGFRDEQVRYLEALVERNRTLPRLLRCCRSGNGRDDAPLPPLLDSRITTTATTPPPLSPSSSSSQYPSLFGVSRHTPRATSGHVLSGLLKLSTER